MELKKGVRTRISKAQANELGLTDTRRVHLNKALDVLYDEHYVESAQKLKRKYTTLESYIRQLAWAKKVIAQENIELSFDNEEEF